MQQLTCTAPGVIEWRDVPSPELRGPGEAIVRPLAVARCEIDPLLLLAGPRAGGAGASSDDGFALGHEAVVEIVEVGADAGHLAVGQLALCSFQVSCGVCAPCTAGHTAICAELPILSDYGMQPLSGVEYGGMLADLAHVPYAASMLVPVPAGCEPVQLASVPDNVVDGYRAVAPYLAAQPGADVLVVCHGNRSIGLYAALSAVALGAGSVTVESDDEAVLALAEAIGARPQPTDFGRHAARWSIVVDCGTRGEGLLHAIDSTESEGVLHSVSYYLESVDLPLGKMYTRGLRFVIGRAHSAALLPEVVGLIAAGRLDPSPVTTSVIAWDEAPARYLDDTIKLVVTR